MTPHTAPCPSCGRRWLTLGGGTAQVRTHRRDCPVTAIRRTQGDHQ